jgi:glutathione synthase
MHFLILTDHTGHSDQNSLYALIRKLRSDSRTHGIMVASKGDPRNDRFFTGELDSPVYGVLVGRETDFRYDTTGQQFQEATTSTKLGAQDVVWLRLPPPADGALFARLTSFVPAPALKEGPWSHKKPVFINDPEGIVETGSKDFLHHFLDFTAPVRRMQSADDLREFASLYPIVLKPLQEYGGRGLVKVSNGMAEVDGQEFPLDTWLSAADPTAYLGMKFLKNVGQGDKRILVVNGKILGASLRLPAPGQWLCNVARGGTSVVAEVAPEEEAMIAAVAPVLLNKGIVIFGADTLVDDNGKRVLSELNTNSIGGFPQAEAQTGRPILQQTINGIYDYLEERL